MQTVQECIDWKKMEVRLNLKTNWLPILAVSSISRPIAGVRMQ
jgi:hypothetical protein